MTITRHVATVTTLDGATRQVHYRRAGSGPPVILLHMSPRSSAELEPLMLAWADTFTLIAPDTPGYGASDPLPEKEDGALFDLTDFTDALMAFADTLGLERFGLYGHHTGAMIAAECARRHPDRLTLTVANGYLVVTEEEREEILANYFSDYTPETDGRHLAHVWQRIRDQFLFFPWSVNTKVARSVMRDKFAIPAPEILQDDVLDLLRTGTHESDGYGAAFRCDGIDILRGVTGPCLVTAQVHDLLYEDLDRLPSDLPNTVRIQRFDDLDALNDAAKTLLLDHAKDDTPPLTATGTIAGRAWASYADTKTGQLYMRRGHAGSGVPVVLIHNLGSSCQRWQPVMSTLMGKRPFVAFDLPGHGETGTAWGDGPVTIDACAKAIDEALDSLGIESAHVFAYGGGGLVALNLIERTAADIRSLTAVDFWLFDDADKEKLKDRFAPALTPLPYGQHMAEAWYMVRDSELFWPWFETTPDNAVAQPPETDPARLHSRVVDVLKASPAYQQVVQDALSLDSETALKQITIPAIFGPRDGSPYTSRCERAASLAPNGKSLTLSNDHSRRAAAVVALIKD
ncbi:MAG: alpha/beta fold hydrolase [Rhodospirillaceae bacterium]|nr:alpha/beta fold hydrolase [Rhodospirillaceae bacterium]MBT5240591.1 alpha/beta fold hydrolase [Rhodospirillaceae bacterium]